VYGKHLFLMAKIDDLMKQVADARLRRELETAVAELKKRTRFGLVYENHLPEMTALPGLPITEGAFVVHRAQVSGRHAFRVCELSGGQALVEPLAGGQMQSVPVAELIALQRFGEPIYPGLELVGTVERGGPERAHHAVINAENYHAAQLLLHLYEGQVDCLYLDPPYNTGARDWTYNNDYVDSNDAFRHSKWLSFMEKRLRLAKRLLKPDGVLIVTIDEHEVHHLGVLLEEVFPQYLRYMITIVISPQGNDEDNFSRVEEYAFFCCPKVEGGVITDGLINLLPKLNAEEIVLPDEGSATDAETVVTEDTLPDGKRIVSENARRRGAESLRINRPSMFFPIFIDENKRTVVRTGPALKLGQEPIFDKVDGLRPVWPIDGNGDERRWRWGKDTTDKLIAAGEIVLGQHNKKRDSWAINRVQMLEAKRNKHKTVWWHSSHSAGSHGSGILERLLGKGQAFAFPKSVYAVKDCIAAVTRTRPDALIVDFFAGSGTTLHATCLLNAEDDGRRRCILVTNNEVGADDVRTLHAQGHYKGDAEYEKFGIFQRVTRPRSEAAITGTRPDGTPVPGTYIGGRPMADGFAENVSFFRLNYLDPDRVDMGHQFAAIAPLLWLQSGAVGAWDTSDAAKRKPGFWLPPDAWYGVCFRDSAFGGFCEALHARPDVTHAYLVTNSEDAYTQMRAALPPRLTTHRLYRDYLRSFRLKPAS